jgi:hypothetical protein
MRLIAAYASLISSYTRCADDEVQHLYLYGFHVHTLRQPRSAYHATAIAAVHDPSRR